MFLKISQISQENNCVGLSKTGVSCEICKMFKNTYFKEHLRMTASEIYLSPSGTHFICRKPMSRKIASLRRKHSKKTLSRTLN